LQEKLKRVKPKLLKLEVLMLMLISKLTQQHSRLQRTLTLVALSSFKRTMLKPRPGLVMLIATIN